MRPMKEVSKIAMELKVTGRPPLMLQMLKKRLRYNFTNGKIRREYG